MSLAPSWTVRDKHRKQSIPGTVAQGCHAPWPSWSRSSEWWEAQAAAPVNTAHRMTVLGGFPARVSGAPDSHGLYRAGAASF